MGPTLGVGVVIIEIDDQVVKTLTDTKIDDKRMALYT